MKRSVLWLGVVVAVFAAATLCWMRTVRGSDTPAPQLDGPTKEAMQQVVSGNNGFAFKLFQELGKEDGNVFCSPYSIETALAMTAEGSRGQTASEMQSVFGYPADAAARQSGFAALQDQFNSAHADYELSVANALWAQHDYKFLPDYISLLKSHYSAAASPADFAANPDAERLRINDWIAGKTKDRIKDLFPPGTIDGLTRLVLANAVYFKGQWLHKFEPEATMDQNFHHPGQPDVAVPMMTLMRRDLRYVENDNLQVLQLDYEGGLSMVALLPKSNITLSNIEHNLDAKVLEELLKSSRQRYVQVFLPKFQLETGYGLGKPLADLGMPTAFGDDADFSDMTGQRDLYIGVVMHKAFVKVDEEGTEAAAATGVAMETRAAPLNPEQPVVFRADHPFLFLIRDNASGAILFLGRVTDPKA